MLNIQCPDRDDNTDLVSIINEKYAGQNKVELQNLLPRIKRRYREYSQIELNNRLLAGQYSDIEKSALKSLYDSKTSTAKNVTDAILKAQIEKQSGCCLSCGMGDVDQIDHFLPQEHFPEFSILHKNLLPICGRCNEIKSDHIPGNGKDFIHAMYDQIPTDTYLACSIKYFDKVPVAEFSIAPPYRNSRIYNHFSDLKLAARMRKKSTQYFLQILAYKNELDDAFAKEEIVRDQRKIGVCFGTNFWKYILTEAMIATDFVDKI